MENSVLSKPVSAQLPAPSLDAMVDLRARAMADVNSVILEKMGSMYR